MLLLLCVLLQEPSEPKLKLYESTPQLSSHSDTLPLDLGLQAAKGDGNEWVVAPIPIYNPTFGGGLGVVAGYLFRIDAEDKETPPSMVGGGAFTTDSGSWGAALGGKLNLDGDRWRLLSALGGGEVRYDFAGIGTTAGGSGVDVPVAIKTAGVIAEALYRVYDPIYIGPRLQYSRVRTSFDEDDLTGELGNLISEAEIAATTASAGVHIQADTRDSSFWPSRGGVADLRADFFDESLGSDFEYRVTQASYNHFLPLSEGLVLGARGYGRFAGADVPFFALSYFGSGADLRGYTLGTYQDRMLLAGQAEIRWKFLPLWGLVGFAGIGQVAPDLDEFHGDDLLPSIGGGIRFTVAPENGINLRLDFAAGKDDYAFYFGVGEAF